jgi:hypothetical protein
MMENTQLKDALEQIEKLKTMVTTLGGNPSRPVISKREAFNRKVRNDKWRVVVTESYNTTYGQKSASYKNVYIVNGEGQYVAQIYSGGDKEQTFYIAHLITALPKLLSIMQYILNAGMKAGRPIKVTPISFFRYVRDTATQIYDLCDPEKYKVSSYKFHDGVKGVRAILATEQEIEDNKLLNKRGDTINLSKS